MKKFKLHTSLALSTVILLSLTACKDENQESKSVKELQAEEGIPVMVQTVNSSEAYLTRKYSGDLTGHVQKSVYAGVPEYIKDIKVQVGQKVRKGQIVATLDAEGRTPQFRQAKAQYEVLLATKNRLEEVFATGGISQQQLDEVTAQYNAAAANYDAAKQNILIEAPISGVVTDIYMREGEVAIAGKDDHPFMQISDISEMVAKIKVPSSDIHYFKKGLKATIDLGDKQLTGRVLQVPLAANSVTRYFYVDVLFSNKDFDLRPGIFTQVAVVVDQSEGLKIPIDAIEMHGEQAACFIIENNKAKKYTFNPQLIADDFVVADSTLPQSAQVVVSGISLLKDGSKVKIVGSSAE